MQTVAVERYAARKIGKDKVGCFVGNQLYILNHRFLTDDPRIPQIVRKIDAEGSIDLSKWRAARGAEK